MLYSSIQEMEKSDALNEKEKHLRDQQLQFMRRHTAICMLRDMGDCYSHFLAKRLGQGRATVEWSFIHPQCMRATITYRGQVWNIRVPVPVNS